MIATTMQGSRPESRALLPAVLLSLAATAVLLLLGNGLGVGSGIDIALLAAAGGVVVMTTAWRPALGCAVLVTGAALTAGLGRGTVVPFLRTNEALTILVALGLVARTLGRSQRYSAFDVVVLAYTAGSILVPASYLLITRTPAGLDTWQTILAPFQFLLIYMIFSRAELADSEVRFIIQLALAASVIVAVIGMAQVANLPGVRTFIETFYPGGGEASRICSLGPCRATSLLEHWSGLGAYAVLHYTLALALSASRKQAFSTRWLALVMAANALTAFVSGTQAAIIGVGIATLVILLYASRLPKQLAYMAAPLALGVLIFWGQIQARLEQQLLSGGSSAVNSPESLQVRERYWSEVFVPLLREHIWFGTGSVIPPEVPQRLVNYVDNEYLGLGFRAGLVGELLLVVMLVGIVAAGWRCRHCRDPLLTGIGASAASFAVVLAVIGVTAEYLTFAGVAQAFWMLVGIMGASFIGAEPPPRGVIVLGVAEPQVRRLELPWR